MPNDQIPSIQTPTEPAPLHSPRWFTPGVWGIGLASFLADMGHEVPTALFASLVTITLGAPAAVLGLIEGLADGLAGLARFAGGIAGLLWTLVSPTVAFVYLAVCAAASTIVLLRLTRD